jgi:hypothetical protein
MVTLKNHVILKERPFKHVMASYKSAIYDSSYVFLRLYNEEILQSTALPAF